LIQNKHIRDLCSQLFSSLWFLNSDVQVKEIIISYYILMENGKATIEDLDLQCEELIQEEFGLQCNFEVMDAVQKLERLGIITRDSIGRICCLSLKRANEIIGATTEELVMKARQS
jgi:hypothetical protein